MLIAIRNILIIMLLALVLTLAPGGGNFLQGLLTALSLVFLAAIGLLAGRTWRETAMTRDTMTDQQQYVFYGALGAIALMIAGLDELFETGIGTVIWIAVVAGAGYALFATWRAANSY
jgi:hypothetical protein